MTMPQVSVQVQVSIHMPQVSIHTWKIIEITKVYPTMRAV